MIHKIKYKRRGKVLSYFTDTYIIFFIFEYLNKNELLE